MTKEVLVSLQGLQFESVTGSDKIETVVRGEYYKKNNSHFLLYDEVLEGVEGTIKNIIRFGNKELSLTKRGLVNTHIVFEKDSKSLTTYATPFGDILLGIDTHAISLQEEEERILVQAEYILEVSYEYMADCTITIDIRPAKTGEFPFLQEGQSEPS